MLSYLKALPEDAGDGTPILVLLHGRGSDMTDLQGLRDHLPRRFAVITPRAPFPAPEWGYGPGLAWYRFLGEDRLDVDTLDTSVAELDAFLEGLTAELPFQPGPVVMGGFSQGGTVSLTYALRHPGRLMGAIDLSGFLPREDVLGADAEGWTSTPIFWGHGLLDPAIPHSLAVLGRARLVERGADLEVGDYPIGHTIDRDEMADLSNWLETLTEGRRDEGA